MNQLIDKASVYRLREFLSGADRAKLNRAVLVWLIGIAVVVGALLAFLTPIGGIAVIIAALGGLLVLRDVRWGLLALIAIACLLPFASLPFKIGFTPTFLDLAFGALYAVWGVRLITRTQNDFILTPLGLPTLVFVVLAVFCFMLGLSHSRPTANDLRTFAEVLMGMCIFFAAINNVRREPLLRELTAAIVLAGAAEAMMGIVFYVLPTGWTVRLLSPLGRLGYPVGEGALRYINDDPDRPMRAIGTNVDPNILGALLVIVLSIAGVQLVARHPVLPRLWIAGAVALMSVCLFLTYSRSSLFGVVVALGMVALLKYRRLLVVLSILGALLLLLPQTQEYISHFVQGIRVEDRSTQMRMGEYRDALRLIQRYPWIGVGFVGTPDIDLYLGVAMIYLTIAAQMGIIGLLSFVLAMAVFFAYVWGAWRVLPADASLEPLLLGYGAAIFGSLAAGFLDHTLVTYPHAVALMWLILGLGTATARLSLDFSRKFHGTPS